MPKLSSSQSTASLTCLCMSENHISPHWIPFNGLTKSLYGTVILSTTQWQSCVTSELHSGDYHCWNMNLGTEVCTLVVCKIQIQYKPPESCVLLRGHKMAVILNQRTTVGIHLPSKHDDCLPVVQKLLHYVINNAVGDDERAFRVRHWLLWSVAITLYFSSGTFTVGFGVKLQSFISQ